MANPSLTGVLDNNGVYLVGQVMTLTATYSDPDTRQGTVTLTATDSAGNAATVTLPYQVSDPVTLVLSDSEGRSFSKVSDDGSTAVFTAVA